MTLALAAGAWMYVLVSSGPALYSERRWVWALLLGLLTAQFVFGTIHLAVKPWSRHFRSPETRAALSIVTIREFDWGTTTLAFTDEEYAERFAQVNQISEE
jgi:hypothetical protein